MEKTPWNCDFFALGAHKAFQSLRNEQIKQDFSIIWYLKVSPVAQILGVDNGKLEAESAAKKQAQLSCLPLVRHTYLCWILKPRKTPGEEGSEGGIKHWNGWKNTAKNGCSPMLSTSGYLELFTSSQKILGRQNIARSTISGDWTIGKIRTILEVFSALYKISPHQQWFYSATSSLCTAWESGTGGWWWGLFLENKQKKIICKTVVVHFWQRKPGSASEFSLNRCQNFAGAESERAKMVIFAQA